MTYKITVTYGVSPAEADLFEPDSKHGHLDADQAQAGMGAFLRDMLGVENSRIQRIIIQREVPAE